MQPPHDPLMYELEDELHDLCQPLTALQFRLELGRFIGDTEALREAVDGALDETNRMTEAIQRMRERLASNKAQVHRPGDAMGDRGTPKRNSNVAHGASN